MPAHYDKDFVSQSSHNLADVLRTNRNMTENSLKMRAMAYVAQSKAKLLTKTIYEVENNRKLVVEDANIIASKKRVVEEKNKALMTQLEYEKKLNEQKEMMLWEQSKYSQVGEMMNMMTHQWKQPLGVIQSMSEFLSFMIKENKYDSEKFLKNLNLIENQSKNMFVIINDFMEFNKDEDSTIFYLNDAYEKAYGIISPLVPSHYITFDIDIDKDLKIFHNLKHISHIVLNLLNNARDAFDENSDIANHVINIYTTVDNDIVSLHIKDNAGGIPKDILDKVFEPYITSKENGTGLGLWMSKKMAEKIEGTTLKVQVKNGCTHFSINFPLPVML